MLDAGKILVNTLMRRKRVPSVAALILVLSLPALAHDIPADVRVNAFVKPDGQRLSLLVRVPLKAMRDVDFPKLEILFRFAVAERLGTIILSVLVGHTAWHWMTERADKLSRFPWPAFNASQLAGAIRWLLLMMLGGFVWLVREAFRRRTHQRRQRQSTPVPK
jgi:hypothetical protein